MCNPFAGLVYHARLINPRDKVVLVKQMDVICLCLSIICNLDILWRHSSNTNLFHHDACLVFI